MQATYIIQIQDIENYGIHNDEPCHYWKFKGGDTLVVENAPDRDATVIAAVNLTKCVGGTYFQSFVRGWEKTNSDHVRQQLAIDPYIKVIDWADLEEEANKKFGPAEEVPQL